MNKFFTKLTVVLLFLVGGISVVSAQASLKLGLNPYLINTTAALEVESTTKGFLPPRVVAETSITAPATGLIVYNTTSNALLINTGGTGVGSDAAPLWFSMTSDAIPNIVTKTDGYTVLPTDHTILCDNSTKAFTLTLPAATTSTGRIIVIGKVDDSGNTLTFSPALKIGAQSATTLNYAKKPFRVQSDGTNWIVVDNF